MAVEGLADPLDLVDLVGLVDLLGFVDLVSFVDWLGFVGLVNSTDLVDLVGLAGSVGLANLQEYVVGEVDLVYLIIVQANKLVDLVDLVCPVLDCNL